LYSLENNLVVSRNRNKQEEIMAKKFREKIQVNIEMDIELARKLDHMRISDENSRSQFIRKIIRREWVRRTEKSVLENQKVNSGDAKTI
jgi:hypothetical protein